MAPLILLLSIQTTTALLAQVMVLYTFGTWTNMVSTFFVI
jgi:hypothetical protein